MISLPELHRRAVTFPGPGSRMAGLEAALVTIEEQLGHAKSQLTVRLRAKLKREAHDMESDDVEQLHYNLKATVDELFPKVFRGGFVVSLWSVFEACVKDLAEYARREKNLPFGLQELRAGDFLEQMDMFFSRVLDVKAFPDRSVRTKLSEIKGLRNALAHHDGSANELPKSLRSNTGAAYEAKGLLLYSDLHHEYVVPTALYAEQAHSVTRKYLDGLAQSVYKALHPLPLADDA